MTAIVKSIVAALILAALAVAFTISFAVIIYSGPLEPYRSQGIGLTLLGAIPMMIVGSLFFTYRGTLCHPQDVTAILISIATASIAGQWIGEPDALFATVVCFIAVTALATGVAAYLLGRYRLGFLARFMPYPVVGGFVAATGYFLTTGGLGMMLGHEVSVYSLGQLVAPGAVVKWLPWLLAAAAIVAATRMSDHDLILPGALVLAGAGFYAVLALLGLDLEQARQMGLLMGPFEGASFLEGLSYGVVAQANWLAVAGQLPTILAVVAMALLGLLLNASGLELSIGREINFERDLKMAGAANVVSGLGGGLVGYHVLGETIFAHKVGLRGAVAGLSTAAGCAVALIFGAGIISVVPMGLAGAVLVFLGLDLLVTWLWTERRRLPAWDFTIVLLILAVAATVGFLEALPVGLLAAAVLFILSYARLDVVRLHSTLATRRSAVERGVAQNARLAEEGQGTVIYELTGYLFFGTANRLLDRIRLELEADTVPARVILDFARVHDLDTSAVFALLKLGDLCRGADVDLICSGMSPEVSARMDLAAPGAGAISRHPTLESVLRKVEDLILQGDAPEPLVTLGLADSLQAQGLGDHIESQTLAPGDILIEQGSRSEAIFELASGALRAEVGGADGQPLVVARFQPGALVGEIAHYAEVPRTATIVAETPSAVHRFDLASLAASDTGRAAAAEIHRRAATHLARRLGRMTRLARDAGV